MTLASEDSWIVQITGWWMGRYICLNKFMHYYESLGLLQHTDNLKTDSKTLYYSLPEIIIYLFYCKAQQRLKEISIV